MPVTKITASTAMRARDVSRPHEEHIADAAECEEAATRREGAGVRRAETSPPKPVPRTGKASPAVPAPLPAQIPAPPRRRRRRRS